MNSFYPDAINLWNNLDVTLRQEPSLSRFKERLIKIIRPSPKSIFEIHDIKGVKRLLQLRVGLSPLFYHKYRHNFKDTITDLCHCRMQPETTAHFLLHCQSYLVARSEMFDVVNAILNKKGLLLQNDDQRVKCLLYGHENLSKLENKAILKSVLKFILDSKRFD